MKLTVGGETPGRWWLPESPDADESGVLRIGVGGDLELELNGLLVPIERWSEPSIRSLPLVYGMTRTQELVTLVDCLPRGMSFGAPGYATERYAPQVAIVGDLLAEEDLRFSAVRVAFPAVSEWIGVTGLRRHNEGPTVTGIVLNVDPPNITTVQLEDGTEVLVSFEYATPKTSSTMAITEKIYFHYRPSQPLGLAEISDYVAGIRELLSIMRGESVMPEAIDLFSPFRSTSTDVSDDPGRQPLTLIRAMLHPNDERGAGDVEYLLTAAQHPEGLPGLLRRWYSVRARYRPVIEIQSGLHYAPQGLRDPELLLAAVMAESYHRLSEFGQEVEREDMDRWRRLLESAPEEHREWLADFINQRAEPSLRRRLLDLSRSLGPLRDDLCRNVPEYETRVGKWRNRFVHHDPRDASQRLSGGQLFQLAAITRLLIDLCLLQDAGYELARWRDQLLGTRRFRRAAQLKQRWSSIYPSAPDKAPN
jgi:hypothetical protein